MGFIPRTIVVLLVALWLGIAVIGTIDPGRAAPAFGAVHGAIQALG
ncbi:MAG: hypothetical protein ACREFQ_01355 [Stellaceae bacterium]